MNCRRTVALILPSFAGGGAERVMLHLAQGLSRDRFRPVLIVLDGRGPLRGAVPADIALIDLGAARLRQALPGLFRALRAERPDVVLSTMAYLNFAVVVAARAVLGRACRVFLREANMPEVTIRRFPAAWIGRLAYRFTYPLADLIVCNSDTVREALCTLGLERNAIALINNPVDVEAIRGRVSVRPQVRGAATAHFVASGRLTHQKGFDLLIDWFREVPPSYRLTIFGDGEERHALTAQRDAAGLKDRVALPGFVDDPWGEIAYADAFLMPSRWEGMPNAALEALALGTPVVALESAGGLKELADEMAGSRMTVAKGKAEFLAAMRVAVSLGRPSSGVRECALPERFTRQTVVARYEALMDGTDEGPEE